MISKSACQTLGILILLTFQSCLTLFSPNTQNVKIHTNTPHGCVIQNDSCLKESTAIVGLKKQYSVSVVGVRSPGYYDKQDVVVVKRFNPVFFLNLPFVPLGVGLFGVMFDFKTEKMFSYPKSKVIETNLLKPNKREPEERFIEVRKVMSRLSEGDTSMNYYRNYNHYLSGKVNSIQKYTSLVEEDRIEEMKALVSLLKDLGYSDSLNTINIKNHQTVYVDVVINKRQTHVMNYVNINGFIHINYLEMQLEFSFYDAYGKFLTKEVCKVRSDPSVYQEVFISSIPNAKPKPIYKLPVPRPYESCLEKALVQLLASDRVKEVLLQKSEQIPKEKDSSLRKIIAHQSATPVALPQQLNACVSIITNDKAHGSGFVINEEGYVLSNYHVVVNRKEQLKVGYKDGVTLDAVLVDSSLSRDLALLKVVNGGNTHLVLAPSRDSMSLGSSLIAIGTPVSTTLGQSVSKGIYSGDFILNGNRYMRSNLKLNPGNSGGPVLNEKGEVVGITLAKLVGYGTEGMAFLIPISDAVREFNIEVK